MVFVHELKCTILRNKALYCRSDVRDLRRERVPQVCEQAEVATCHDAVRYIARPLQPAACQA